MNTIKLTLIGFGNVGRAFAQLLLNKKDDLLREHKLDFLVTGLETKRHGRAIDQDGIDLSAALELVSRNHTLEEINRCPQISDSIELIKNCCADILIESIPVNYQTGEPALSMLKYGLERGMHIITANKGPVVHGYQTLSCIARKQDKKFYFESAVMDGAPIFSLFRNALPSLRIIGFKGILNSTTNKILCLMEDGRNFDEAVAYTQKIGIAETDPSGDIDGWDAAVKVAALATVLMDKPLLPVDVDREGIRSIKQDEFKKAKAQGKRWKLLCTARFEEDRLISRVAPEMVEPGSIFYAVEGTSSLIEFETDLLGKFSILEQDPSPETTAYGLFSDLLDIATNG